MRGIHRSPVNSPHKGPVTRKMFPCDDVIMSVRKMHCKISSAKYRPFYSGRNASIPWLVTQQYIYHGEYGTSTWLSLLLRILRLEPGTLRKIRPFLSFQMATNCGRVTPYDGINLAQLMSCCMLTASHYLNQC